ncbi:hypothetical protein [Candidatus Kryptonium thompsonii]|uniref:hypothetical protein n=1 Tax=Candidatus Kryptonium thompsonii TaxID=1633631 RepID=UPI00159EC262|nr:hypothetical protein [Candidatus Kryptonium thompsoni]
MKRKEKGKEFRKDDRRKRFEAERERASATDALTSHSGTHKSRFMINMAGTKTNI